MAPKLNPFRQPELPPGNTSLNGASGSPGVLDDNVQVRAIDVGKRYDDFAALHNISIDIQKREFLTLLGPSGSGKTTFLMVLAGFTPPTSGRLLEAGVDITRRPPEKRNFGMVFQGYSLFPHMDVFDNVAFPLRIRKVPISSRRKRVNEMLEIVGLGDHREKKPSELSGGQKQRVAIARALVFEPDLLLLDEPLSALDKNLREQLQTELKRIHRDVGTTFVFVTHDQSEALALSSRVAIFNEGGLVQIDKPDTVYNRPCSRFVAEFLGRINVFHLDDIEYDSDEVRGRFGNLTLRVRQSGDHEVQQPAVLGVRPEHMTLHMEPPNKEPGNLVPVTITDTIYQGGSTTLKLDAGHGAPLMTITLSGNNTHLDPEQGGKMWLGWPLDKGIILANEN